MAATSACLLDFALASSLEEHPASAAAVTCTTIAACTAAAACTAVVAFARIVDCSDRTPSAAATAGPLSLT